MRGKGGNVDDVTIIELYWQRNEDAIAQTKAVHGAYCRGIALRVLADTRDADECENDTYLGAWNAMPSARPQNLRTFLGKIARNLALKRLRARTAEKRGGGEAALSLDELEECVSAPGSVDEHLEAEELASMLNAFLAGLSADDRRVFMCRYWHFDSVAEIAQRFGFTQSKVKMSLSRTRKKLASYLEEEGVNL